MLIFVKVQWQNFTGRKCPFFLLGPVYWKRKGKTNRTRRTEKIGIMGGHYKRNKGGKTEMGKGMDDGGRGVRQVQANAKGAEWQGKGSPSGGGG